MTGHPELQQMDEQRPDHADGIVVDIPHYKDMSTWLPETEDQSELLAVRNAARPVPGAWGRKRSTTVTLSRVERADLREWLAAAWRRRATPKLPREHPDV
jgi:hypothetical protein